MPLDYSKIYGGIGGIGALSDSLFNQFDEGGNLVQMISDGQNGNRAVTQADIDGLAQRQKQEQQDVRQGVAKAGGVWAAADPSVRPANVPDSWVQFNAPNGGGSYWGPKQWEAPHWNDSFFSSHGFFAPDAYDPRAVLAEMPGLWVPIVAATVGLAAGAMGAGAATTGDATLAGGGEVGSGYAASAPAASSGAAAGGVTGGSSFAAADPALAGGGEVGSGYAASAPAAGTEAAADPALAGGGEVGSGYASSAPPSGSSFGDALANAFSPENLAKNAAKSATTQYITQGKVTPEGVAVGTVAGSAGGAASSEVGGGVAGTVAGAAASTATSNALSPSREAPIPTHPSGVINSAPAGTGTNQVPTSFSTVLSAYQPKFTGRS